MVEAEPQPVVEPSADDQAEVQPAVEPSAEENKEENKEEENKEAPAQEEPAPEEDQKEEEKKGWDGEPLLSDEELKRQEDLFEWLINDIDEWEAAMTEEERKAQEDFEDSLRKPADEGGDEIRKAFTDDFDEAFASANVSADGFLKEAEFRPWLDKLNDLAINRQLKAREHTDEYVANCWKAFNGHKPDEEGVSKKSCIYVLRYCSM